MKITIALAMIVFFTGTTSLSLFLMQREVSAMREELRRPIKIELPQDTVNVHVLNAVKIADVPLPVLETALETPPITKLPKKGRK